MKLKSLKVLNKINQRDKINVKMGGIQIQTFGQESLTLRIYANIS